MPAPAELSDATHTLHLPLSQWSDPALTKLASTSRKAHQPMAVLLKRHWTAARTYAAICTTSTAGASALAEAAAKRLYGQMLSYRTPPALRPALLIAVRETATSWAAGQAPGIPEKPLHPELTATIEQNGAVPRPDRRLIAEALRELPGTVQCLLWHQEVEAEDVPTVAALLGMPAATASAESSRARGLLRARCLTLHGVLAPSSECRNYTRLLEASIARQVTPDVEAHIFSCQYCRDALVQFDQNDHTLPTLLAEAVLGWGAKAYLQARRRTAPDVPAATASEPRAGYAGHLRRRHASAKRPERVAAPAQRDASVWIGAKRTPRYLVGTAVGLCLTALLGSAALMQESEVNESPSHRGEAYPDRRPTPSHAEALQLRSAATGLCVQLQNPAGPNGTIQPVTAACTRSIEQQWSYEEDGTFRSRAQPHLCLDSRSHQSGLLTALMCPPPSDPAPGMRYTLTLRGQLTPQWNRELCVAPVSQDAGAMIGMELCNSSKEKQLTLLSGNSTAGGKRKGLEIGTAR
ncbi:ricin-type beta-trefoil lectin domain protein [Streptomyces sp. NPDC091376]|uniref:ricin-type beta-trefoil lectin domain protein n=1 Tax=Streptomyces sp. NPDC091376 TaxID=3365994 RepID=UPI003822A37A